MKDFLIVALILALGSCTTPGASTSASVPAFAPGTDFPVAAPPQVDADERSLEERDLETIGRRR